MDKFDNIPDYGNFSPVMLNVTLNISLNTVKNHHDGKMQMLAVLT